MTRPPDPSNPGGAPTVAEIAALTARLREISNRGRDVDPTELAQFLADKDALIARITNTDTYRGRATVRERYAAHDALSEAVRGCAEHPGYVLVGPSARTWLRDPVTGQPAAPVTENEHRAVYELLDREELDTTEPAWVTGPDGRHDVHSTVVPTAHTDDATGDGDTLDTSRDHGPEMPDWMRDQARQTEAAIASGTEPDLPTDDRAVLAERIAALRAAQDEHGPGAPTARETVDAAERAFDELCERHPLPGDGPGEWVTDRSGTYWADYGDVIDDDTPISPEIATANPDIWDHDHADVPAPRSPSGRSETQQGRSASPHPCEPEQDRREQLARRHAEDQADATDDALTRFTCGGSYDVPERG